MSGRSRGRARTTPQPAATPAATPGTTLPPSAESLSQEVAAAAAVEVPAPTIPAVAPVAPSTSAAARMASPHRAPAVPPVSELPTGRGRGISAAVSGGGAPGTIVSETISSTTGTSALSPSGVPSSSMVSPSGVTTTGITVGRESSSSGSKSNGSGNGNISPTAERTASSPEEQSPPQQHSPPGAISGAVGRAAIRGAPNQGTTGTRQTPGGLDMPRMAELALEETGRFGLLRTRPATCVTSVGTVGTPVKVLCNYFSVLNQPDWKLYQYRVDYIPNIESKRLRIALLKDHEQTLFPHSKAFDGTMMFTTTLLRDDPTEITAQTRHDNSIITIRIRRTNEIVSSSPDFVHIFNLVFRRCLKHYGMKQLGVDRNYYDMNRKIEISQYNLELINGFTTAISNYENRLLLCAELTHKLLHKTTVFNLMREAYNSDPQGFRETCTARCVGRIVMTKYSDKTYQINDINWDATPMSTFDYRGEQITFVDYYKKQYNIEIREKNQPLLSILPSKRDVRRGQTRPMLLVPELCILTGVDEAMRNDFRFKKAVDEYTKVGPAERCKRLTNFISTFNANPKVQDELNSWQINFDSNPCQITARVLPADLLLFGDNKTKQLDHKADWSNEIKGRVLKPVNISEWLIVFPRTKSGSAESFAMCYAQTIRSMGISANEPYPIQIPQDTPDAYVNALKANIKPSTQMVVCVVSSKRKDRYDAIKRVCCLELPVPSQVVTSQIVDDERKRRSVVTKIALQMNVKLGGELWATSIPIKDLMICGIDTYHDSANKKKSVCAFIATSNEAKTRFFSRATLQETHQELSSNYTVTVKSAIENYRRVNGKLPEKIIIYRDGVSDGQLRSVVDNEIPQIIKAFEMVETNYKPLMAFIVVKKRISARFFALQGNDLVNPPCGTVVDTVVTRSEWFDFYLIPQSASQGTVNPTHFNIIHDTIGLKAEHYQRMSFKLSHMYYNWPGTIRVPAPCQYAHKLAFLVGQSLHREHHQVLCDKLYYL